MKFAFTLFVVGLCVGCGGSTPAAAPATPAETTGSEHNKEGSREHHDGKGEKHEGHHEGLSPALKDFHHVIAPVWHSEPGATRVGKACADTKALRDKAQVVADAELIAAAAAVDTACEKPGRADVEARLGTLHDRFHVLIKPVKPTP